ncbi:zinc finger, CCCH-type [Artemisia annua]|uniref:Zinc finger, CCCH-type n=1 Tax=Artemisia annua TaxID=35608 RepID=A0A2U1NZH4_ARTAN|nr:zinc finger, CCCH-type [Artemisia annua]
MEGKPNPLIVVKRDGGCNYASTDLAALWTLIPSSSELYSKVKRVLSYGSQQVEKKISICGHYMNGKCHEGEKCKFSHNTIPLTKSKPWCHFARYACMKGDYCPYDH